MDVTADLAGPGAPATEMAVQTISGANGVVVFDGGGVASHVTADDPIVLVTATGANTATFSLVGGAGFTDFGGGHVGLVKGPWLYTIDNNVPVGGTNDTVLVSQPGPLAKEAPILATAAQDVWYATAPWQDRQADLRTQACWRLARSAASRRACGSRRSATGPAAPTTSIRAGSCSTSATTRTPTAWWAGSTSPTSGRSASA